EKELSIEESFSLSRTSKETILQSLYNDFDFAAAHLPTQYSSAEVNYPTKGAALGLKARVALHMSDWEVVRDAAKACIDLNVYELLPDFGDVLTQKMSKETILARPRSATAGVV